MFRLFKVDVVTVELYGMVPTLVPLISTFKFPPLPENFNCVVTVMELIPPESEEEVRLPLRMVIALLLIVSSVLASVAVQVIPLLVQVLLLYLPEFVVGIFSKSSVPPLPP